MSLSLFYRQQTQRQQAAADTATLQNVKERCQRASDAWAALAARAERGDNVRTAAASNKLLDGTSENPDRGFAAA